jgi:hypothetical protein
MSAIDQGAGQALLPLWRALTPPVPPLFACPHTCASPARMAARASSSWPSRAKAEARKKRRRGSGGLVSPGNRRQPQFCRRPLLARNRSNYLESPIMKNGKHRSWTTADVRTLKSLARKKTRVGKIAKKLKRTEGATRQKAFSLGVSLESRF